MKQFFKFMFASMLGFFLTLVVLVCIFIGIVSGLMMSLKDDSPVVIGNNSVLELKFESVVKERTSKNPFENASFSGLNSDKTPGLNDILKCISKAKTDGNIKGLFLNLTSLTAGLATAEEIRDAIIDFKKSGKFVYAYSESYSQGGYYLASAADKIYMYPEGDLDFKGLHVELMFFKGLLDKLEIHPEIIRHGKFKSAVEPFILDKMSPENREQTSVFVGSIWKNILKGISASRNISVEELQRIADGLEARTAQSALDLHLVDKVSYYDEVMSDLRQKTGQGEKEKISFISLKRYSRVFVAADDFSAKKIAVIYAGGEIVDGEGGGEQMGSKEISEAIRKARLDSSVKAIVLRVNSPGGSALASDVIWRETILAKKAKPLIVSMGDYAASGGYYIACAADTIVARPNTITGSIGVFGLLFNARDMFKDKLGITFDTIKTGRMADIGTISREMNESEKAIIQNEVEKVYDKFITHVSEGRHLTKAQVDSIGQGRVWTGEDAKKIGLVDVLGGLDDAVKIAAVKAHLLTYRTIGMPEQKEFLESIMEEMNTKAVAWVAGKELGENYGYYKRMNDMIQHRGILAKIPFSMEIE